MLTLQRKWLVFYAAVAFVVCVICVLHTFRESIFHQTTAVFRKSALLFPPPPQSMTFVSENFTCNATKTEEGILPSYPDKLKEFLRHRHCRRFPVVLRPTPCEDDLYLLFVIKSMASQVERRAAVRDTWGHAGRSLGRPVKLVFLLGRSQEKMHNNDLQSVLRWEHYRHGDILQWDFDDNFYNLTLKELGFLSWFSSSCSSAQFVFKGDDDIFAHTKSILKYLGDHKPETPMLTGYIFKIANPLREIDSKYFIPVELYPSNDYPSFMSGGGYLMSRQTVLNLNKGCQNVTRFPLDDVFLGMCLEKIGQKLTHHPGFVTFGFKEKEKYYNPCSYNDLMVLHKLEPGELRVMWTLILDGKITCMKLLEFI